jgi:hypothetical protein
MTLWDYLLLAAMLILWVGFFWKISKEKDEC